MAEVGAQFRVLNPVTQPSRQLEQLVFDRLAGSIASAAAAHLQAAAGIKGSGSCGVRIFSARAAFVAMSAVIGPYPAPPVTGVVTLGTS